ncbi:uncharacterized protein Z520_03096 [Fonsecaea multimorphosa CBS 102226]|uniref:Mitotic checkpoint regulator, MAD2B-interacting-domain-containing protein n=1 Tax=Fonsecaea multimorphosa CBS 102226 TaxID=1442371 RepID=A0A0D2KXJ2_9EURO|nr:uncharacterized protein Z520_03096 [Fonsecaea multimorphosa CBS 102226]KIY01544.1 hypothetical protein Z520_03096 [Fonsecaea multimorphosa CBS 102226]OAL28058.1 hypothetical protein AYO22_03085 [Fonsecaea multimorphosa]
MALVAYSDSEGSEDEKVIPQAKAEKPATKTASNTNTTFTVDKANPRKIQVKLQDAPINGNTDGEPPLKRPRIGAGAGTFSGFNAMLPAPKRDADAKAPPKPATRKVFSLKTGAEPGFSREADEELRNLFAEQEQQRHTTNTDTDETMPSIPKRADPATNAPKEQSMQGNPFMFKPLSVARNNKKSKRKVDGTKSTITLGQDAVTTPVSRDASATSLSAEPVPPPKKVSLFSMGGETATVQQPQPQQDEDEIVEFLDEPLDEAITPAQTEGLVNGSATSQPQSLDSIAADLNLSKADRRQLFGRRGQPSGTAINVVNFNTDQEYAANEVLRANGEQVQHNPVRAIAPGKHSLKQLVNAATGQKEALEESFATGRRNKKEAGSKYGW